MKSVASIPGLYTAGVDVMIDSFDTDNPYILEINSFPHINIAINPYYGPPQNMAKAYLKSIFAQHKLLNDSRYLLSDEELELVKKVMDFRKFKNELI